MDGITLPFTQKLAVKPFTIFSIHGKPTGNAYRFIINFFGGESPDCGSKVFHFNPRFDQNKVAMNTMVAGKYGKEEHASSFPFARGKSFVLEITITAANFEIYVDGNFLHTYRQRTPFNDIRMMIIENHPKGNGPSLRLTRVGVEAHAKRQLLFTCPRKTDSDGSDGTAEQCIREGNVIQLISRAAYPGALRVRRSGMIDAKGGTGKKAQFFVQCPAPGVYSFQNVKDPMNSLTIRDGTLTIGKGGPHCSFRVSDPIGSGEYVCLESVEYHGQFVAVNESGHPTVPQRNKGHSHAHFSVRVMNDPERYSQASNDPPPAYEF